LEVTLKQELPLLHSDGGDASFAMDARLLFSMLGLLAGEVVEVELCENGQILISGEAATYQLPALDGKDYPRMEIPFPGDTVKVSGLPCVVQKTAFATGENQGMPLLKCVNLKLTRDGLTAVGSDGQCLISTKGDKRSTGDVSFLVPAQSLEKLAKLCENQETFSMGTTGQQLVFLKDRFAYSARLMDGQYIDTDRLIGSLENTFSALTDAVELRNALGSVMTVATNNRVNLMFLGDTLQLSCQGDTGRASTTISVIPLMGIPSGEYCYTASRMEKCLRVLDGTMTLGIAKGGMLTLTTEDTLYMQTPLRTAAQKTTQQASKAA
jgi:DNA polymerase III sliding clamp (beta) subunit (PCNA family)